MEGLNFESQKSKSGEVIPPSYSGEKAEEVTSLIKEFQAEQKQLDTITSKIKENPDSPYMKGLLYEENRHKAQCAQIEDKLREYGVDVEKYYTK